MYFRRTPPLASALALLAGCLGGQTGESGTGNSNEACTGDQVTEVGLDEELPGDFTAREVLKLFQNKDVPAFVFPFDIAADDRLLAPEDATSTTRVWVDFEPDGSATLPAFEGACGPSGLVIHGTFTVSALDGTYVREGEGTLRGTPERASLRADEPELFQGGAEDATAACRDGQPAMTVDSIDGVLIGQLCADDELVRFPTACGGYAQVPLDEAVDDTLPLPSAMLERLSALDLEVVWTEADRAPLAMSLSAGENACYAKGGYDNASRPLRTWDVALDVDVSIAESAITLRDRAALHGGITEVWDANGAILDTCDALSEDALAALEPRLPRPIRSGEVCLYVEALEDGSLEMALRVSGEAAQTTAGDDTPPRDVGAVWEVREIAP